LVKDKYNVLGIGNAIVDIISVVDKSFLVDNNLVPGSMKLVDQKETKKIQSKLKIKKMQAGGSVANSIAGISILKGKCAFIGKKSDDFLGNSFSESMNNLGVTLSDYSLKKNSNLSTASCVVLVTDDGQRTMCTHLGVSVNLEVHDIAEDLIERSSIIYLEGYLFDLPSAKKSFIKAAKLAKKYNKKVALSLSDSFCVDRHRDSFKDFIKNNVDILFANEDEIKSLYEKEDLLSCSKEIYENIRMAIITKGKDGASGFFENKRIDVDSIITNVVDTTGAGDLFAAGFLNYYCQGFSLEKSMKAGVICATEIIKDYGARPNNNLINILIKNNLN
tara:strand:- start:360 stop:1358 length:999 start_codon:yes stop_codon:yes gene_type:complete